MKNKIFFLVLASLVFSLGMFADSVSAQSIAFSSCPPSSILVGCKSGVLIPGQDLVIPKGDSRVPTNIGVKLVKLNDDTYQTISVQDDRSVWVAKIPDGLDSSSDWNIYVLLGDGKTMKIAENVRVMKEAQATEPLPGVGGSAGGGAGGTAATPGGVTSGGGSVRTGLDQIKKEFQTTGDIAGATSIGSLIVGVIRFLMGILLAVAILMVIIGGFMYVTSAGNEERAKSGRKTIMYALMGVAVVILAYVLVNLVDSAISTGSPF